MKRRTFLQTAACLSFPFDLGLRAAEPPAKELSADVVIVGGSVGGCAAALAAAAAGRRVILTEETDWIGGHQRCKLCRPTSILIESFGCTRSPPLP